ncbi:MAG: hypothetical protein P8J63_04120 [Verrucomicrobiota bacterium]|nr:hypothetical protein [Verrucomicrobiota bacterium]|tara:strand:- start:1069 stop:1563 length:495 start_codon:yes stop_codon:yes gene_type:complete
MKNYLKIKNYILFLLLAATLGCGNSHDHNQDHHDHSHGDGHGHQAPRGGVLVNVEDEFCHLEFVQEPGTTRLQMHAFRFHPREAPVEFFMEKIEATAAVNGEVKAFTFRPTQLDGITATTEPTSLYVAEIDWLKDTAISTGILTELKIEGKTLSKITFQFPKKD